MLKTADNPDGLPMKVFDGSAPGSVPTAPSFTRISPAGTFFGFNRPARRNRRASSTPSGCKGMMAGHKNAYDCIKAFSETDFPEDLKKFDVPTLIIHGDDDQIVPIIAAAPTAKAREERDAQVSTGAARPHRHAQGPAERRPLGVP